ncbi:MAG: YbhB/YbcL family Raf kinase inhibitor-like protein [Candidatus Sericytochromatia bacterium]|nr:YbhB/YbcL family Raf kinase inhibitor-like protein [Candidatus Tanganyikabacteria bacterium]
MFRLESASYQAGGTIPARYAMAAVKGGENRSPEFHWSNVPGGTQSFALALIDRHPVARGWVHWVVVDLPGDAASLPEGASGTLKLPRGAFELANSFGRPGYGGPQPPPGTGPHQYEATLFALSIPKLAGLSAKSPWEAVQGAMAGKILGKATLSGTFER